MANRIRRGKGGKTAIHITVDAEPGSAALKTARKRIRTDISDTVRELGERFIARPARVVAPKIAAHAITVRATGGRGYLTVKGKRILDRIIGLWNFGGTVDTPIKPKKTQALLIGPGIVRAEVSTPRVYEGTGGLQKAVEGGFRPYADALLDHIMNFFDPLEHSP